MDDLRRPDAARELPAELHEKYYTKEGIRKVVMASPQGAPLPEVADLLSRRLRQPSTEQWQRLYHVAGLLKQMRPWDIFEEHNVITVLTPNMEEPCFCSTMGSAGEAPGVNVFPGYRSLNGFRRLLEGGEMGLAEELLITRMSCLVCYFGDREELTPEDREIIKRVGVKYRGRKQWIYFRAMRPGHIPWFLDADDVDTMAEAMEQFLEACRYVLANNFEFEDGDKHIVRYYDSAAKGWYTALTDHTPMPILIARREFMENIAAGKVKRKKKTMKSLEMDLLLLPHPIQENKEQIPFLPYLLLLAEQNGTIVGQHIMNPGETVAESMLQMLNDYMLEHGRPRNLSVRDETIAGYIVDHCAYIQVPLLSEGTPVIDQIFEDMQGFFTLNGIGRGFEKE